ncbi:MAG TPA: triose-phosphate isomerase [Chitinophagaceae bacterium]|nr:triose-phosphate isomerase [Chitinophagaceae bacterium]
MRTQIAAGNWKMNCTYQEAERLIDAVLNAGVSLPDHQKVIFAVPFPFLLMTRSRLENEPGCYVAAQNCHHERFGAFTGEISAPMLHSIAVLYCIVGHSERREYNAETHPVLAEKVNRCFENFITPIFCCGEPLAVRETGGQNEFVDAQLRDSLFHLPSEKIRNLIIAYEPVWAIGTGRNATADQAQEMHAHIRSILSAQYGRDVADSIPILYGGSVKSGNSRELFSAPDVDGGLVGGASLIPEDFVAIIRALK